MSVTISKDFEFSAAHHLPNVAADHPCRRVHGHNYVVRVSAEADVLDPRTGMVIDFRDFAPLKAWMDSNLDHRDLNSVLDNPTSEFLAQYLLKLVRATLSVPGITWSVGVSETPKTWAVAR